MPATAAPASISGRGPYRPVSRPASGDSTARGSVFPWCFTPETYAAKPEYIDSLAEFVRSRPMPPVDAFLRQSDAVLTHDASGVLGRIEAPTQITFGEND